MIRQGSLAVLVGQIDALIPEAAARFPLYVTDQVKQLRDLCRSTSLDTSDTLAVKRSEQIGKAIELAADSPLHRSNNRRAGVESG